MKKMKGMAPAVPKAFYGLVFIAGILLLVVWTAAFLIPQGRYFDVGLFSLSMPLILFGGVGYVLYGEQESRSRRR